MNQIGFPSDVSLSEISRKPTLGKAIELCAEAAGLEPKQIQDKLKTDKGQWSRWVSGGEGITWEKFEALMDECGNDAPVLWMVNRRGYDLNSLRRKESETERELRLSREEVAQLKHDKRVLTEALRGAV